jgi:hypothetical protein
MLSMMSRPLPEVVIRSFAAAMRRGVDGDQQRIAWVAGRTLGRPWDRWPRGDLARAGCQTELILRADRAVGTTVRQESSDETWAALQPSFPQLEGHRSSIIDVRRTVW